MTIFGEPTIKRTSGLVNFQQKTRNLDFLCAGDKMKMKEKHEKNQPLLVEELCSVCKAEARKRMWEVYLEEKKMRRNEFYIIVAGALFCASFLIFG